VLYLVDRLHARLHPHAAGDLAYAELALILQGHGLHLGQRQCTVQSADHSQH